MLANLVPVHCLQLPMMVDTGFLIILNIKKAQPRGSKLLTISECSLLMLVLYYSISESTTGKDLGRIIVAELDRLFHGDYSHVSICILFSFLHCHL